MLAYTYVYVIIEKEKTMNLKGREGSGGRKWTGRNDIILLKFQKKKLSRRTNLEGEPGS